MKSAASPAMEQFVSRMGEGALVVQVQVERMGPGYELRHAADRGAESGTLRRVHLSELRELAQFTAEGRFRPLKSAPNLRRGWRCSVETVSALESALHQLYPGGVPDWFAAQAGAPPVTGFREFAGRQTGMYRITAQLTDEAAGRVIGICCGPGFCLKRRLWTVEGLAADEPEGKSLIPCLEPCALLLEFARKVARLEQEPAAAVSLAEGDLETLRAGLAVAGGTEAPCEREADFGDPRNPRRLAWVLEKLKHCLPASTS